MQKAALFLTVFTGSIMLNDIFGFTFYYNSLRKVEQMTKLTAIIKDPETDSTGRMHAIALRERLLERESYSFVFLERQRTKGNLSQCQEKDQTPTIVPTIIKDITKVSIKDFYLLIISSVGIYLILIPIIFFEVVFLKKNAHTNESIIAYYIIFLVLMLAAMFVHTLLTNIPVIWGSPLWNYLLNFLIQSATIIFIQMQLWKYQKSKRR